MRVYAHIRHTRSHESAAAFRASFERRQCRPPVVKHPTRAEEAAEFRAFVLTKIGRLVPKLTHVIHRDVEDEWGEVCLDRVRRALRRLLADGEVTWSREGYLLAARRQR